MLSSRGRILASLLIPIAALALSTGYWWNQLQANQKLRETARQAAEYRVAQLASAVAQQTEILFQMTDTTLQTLANEYAVAERPAFLRSAMNMRDSFPAAADMQISVNDRQGRIVYSSVALTHPVSVADREYFRVHFRARKTGLFVGGPLIARTTKTWAIPFSRPMSGAHGLVGVVTIGISPVYLSQRWRELKLLPRDVVSIVRRDGRYLARSLSLQRAMTARVPASADWFRHPDRRQGLFESNSYFDGVHRLNGWQRLDGEDMVAVVGLDMDAVMQPVESHIRQVSLRNLAVNVLLLLGCLWIAWLMARLQRSRAMLQAIYDVLPVGIVVADARGRIVDCNRMSEQLLGQNRQTQLAGRIGSHCGRFLRSDGSPVDDADLPGLRALHGGQVVHHEEMGFVHPDEGMRWLSVSAIPGTDAGFGVIVAFVDVTQARDYRQAVEHIAFHDALTGLPNRRLLLDRLGTGLSQATRQSGRLAVAFLDLDGFKQVNDCHGHEAGDRLLISIAQRLQAAVRAGDTVARLGGDEFVVVLSNLGSNRERDEVLARIASAVALPVNLGTGQSVRISASIGVAMPPPEGCNAETLLHCADLAMYQAKQTGRYICHFRHDGP